MPEAFAIYETLSLADQQEILDFIYFIAARAKRQQLNKDEEKTLMQLREASLAAVWENVKNDVW